MVRRTADELFMTQALELARQGVGLASPNPCVGAIVVDERGRIVGRGVHHYAKRKHAEVLALEEAGPLARGNTLYLNLEPCCHTGRTGPCTEAILAAGVGRLVAAMRDPNPLVGGKGFEQLRRAGVDVSEGVLELEARKLNEAFAHFIRTGKPFVTLKSAMTLDGKIAGAPLNPAAGKGSTTYITGASALRQVHRLRHASDAILAGIGTVIADDPMLTDRSELPRRRPLLRVILDSHLRIPVDSRIVASAADDLIVFCVDAADEKKDALESCGVRVERLPAGPEKRFPDLQCVLDRLGKMQITSLLVEGGATVNWAFLKAGAVDKVWFFYAPKILGGSASVGLASGEGFGTVADAAQLRDVSLHRYGEDFAVEGYLRDPYA
ncbi:MAG: bifunctional diaminohydroxyphosphoribosylaminopyrimidine deaminase/5-amino-6-(5-phosphoribosylamino)uracil reductase RibD [Candidatus Korobacteraceae bacterium]|jgi:diaminohydroxyphosphoribosylaminopyrimidine deaminase/5-amino-6-(5-phosphoribosylamino)uracil reductase